MGWEFEVCIINLLIHIFFYCKYFSLSVEKSLIFFFLLLAYEQLYITHCFFFITCTIRIRLYIAFFVLLSNK